MAPIINKLREHNNWRIKLIDNTFLRYANTSAYRFSGMNFETQISVA